MQWEYEYVRCGLKQQQTPCRSTVVALMETMSPQQGTIGQNRSGSLTGNSKFCALPDSKKVTRELWIFY